MSREAVDAFAEHIARTEELQDQMKELWSRHVGDLSGYVEALVSLGQEHRFEFTAEEASGRISETARELSTGELTDDQLENVAGGAGELSLNLRPAVWLMPAGPNIALRPQGVGPRGHSLGWAWE